MEKSTFKLGPKDKQAILICFAILVVIAIFSLINTLTNNRDKALPEPINGTIGSDVDLGNFIFTIISVDDKKGADGNKTIKLTVSVKNNGKNAESVTSNMFKLIDSDDRTFDSDTFQSDLTNFTLNPGLMQKGNIVFEVPEDASDLTAVVSAAPGEEYAYVNLGL